MKTEQKKKQAVLVAHDLMRHFRLAKDASGSKPLLRAVDGVSLALEPGKTVGIVGESGCGKSTLGRLLVGLLKPTSGTVHLDGVDLQGIVHRKAKSQRPQMVFQDPSGSFDPRMSIRKSLAVPLLAHSRSDSADRVGDYLARVGLDARLADRFPHELSGGQQQRAAIARALLPDPSVVVLDEAVSALDVSLRAQILNLLLDLQNELGIAYVFISHDLRAVEAVSDNIVVMYLGQIVEKAPAGSLGDQAMHPYTIALRSASLAPDPEEQRRTQRIVLKGDLPSAVSPPKGCRFSTRCPLAQEICHTTAPPLLEHKPGHWASCHFATETTALLEKSTNNQLEVS